MRAVAAERGGHDLHPRVEVRDRQRRAPVRRGPRRRRAPRRSAPIGPERGDANARGDDRVGLADRARGVQLAGEGDDRARARGRLGAGRADRVEQVRRPVGAARARRADRAGQHDRRVGGVDQVAEDGGLLERVGAVRDDDAAPGGGLGDRGARDRERVGRARRGRPASCRACAPAARAPRRAPGRPPRAPPRRAAEPPRPASACGLVTAARPPWRSSRPRRAPSPRAPPTSARPYRRGAWRASRSLAGGPAHCYLCGLKCPPRAPREHPLAATPTADRGRSGCTTPHTSTTPAASRSSRG